MVLDSVKSNVRSKRVLVTGASGYLGQHLLFSLSTNVLGGDDNDPFVENTRVIAAYGSLATFEDDFTSSRHTKHPNVTIQLVGGVDFSLRSSIDSLFSGHGPFDVVVNLAALSSPYACQTSPEKAVSINREGLLYLSKLLPESTDIIHLSTDQVYEGTASWYKETDAATPLNVYGETKLASERDLLACRTNAIALRSSLIIGPSTPLRCRKQTFLQFIVDRLLKGEETNFFTDEYRSVVFVCDVVEVIRYYINNRIGDQGGGIFNMGGSDRVSRFDLVCAVADHLNLSLKSANGVERASLPPGKVPSPLDISMDISKLKIITGIEMKGLKEMVEFSLPKNVP